MHFVKHIIESYFYTLLLIFFILILFKHELATWVARFVRVFDIVWVTNSLFGMSVSGFLFEDNLKYNSQNIGHPCL